MIFAPGQNEQMVGYVRANLNTLNDQLITLAEGNKRITRIVIVAATGTTATVQGGFYTGAGKTGTIVVPASQVYSSLTATKSFNPTVNNDYLTGTSLYLTLDVAEGSACLCDVYVFAEFLSN